MWKCRRARKKNLPSHPNHPHRKSFRDPSSSHIIYEERLFRSIAFSLCAFYRSRDRYTPPSICQNLQHQTIEHALGLHLLTALLCASGKHPLSVMPFGPPQLTSQEVLKFQVFITHITIFNSSSPTTPLHAGQGLPAQRVYSKPNPLVHFWPVHQNILPSRSMQ